MSERKLTLDPQLDQIFFIDQIYSNITLSPVTNTNLYISNFNGPLNFDTLEETGINIVINVCEEDHELATKQMLQTMQV